MSDNASSSAAALEAATSLYNSLISFRHRWTEDTMGCPTHNEGLMILQTLMDMAQHGRCSPVISSLIPVDDIMPASDPATLASLAMADLVGMVKRQNGMGVIINGRSDRRDSATSISVLQSLIRTVSTPLGPEDPFAAMINYPVTSSAHLGSRKFHLPDFLMPFAPHNTTKNHHIDVGISATPAGWITHPHGDYYGAISALVHVMGHKLWLTFPRNEHNAEVMDNNRFSGGQLSTVEILAQVEDVSCMIIEEPTAFVLMPFEYHCCLSLEACLQIGGAAYRTDDAAENVRQIQLLLAHLSQATDMTSEDKTVISDELEGPLHYILASVDKIYDLKERSEAHDTVQRVQAEVTLLGSPAKAGRASRSKARAEKSERNTRKRKRSSTEDND